MSGDATAALHYHRLNDPAAPWRAGEPTTDLGPELELREADIDGKRHVALFRAGARCTAWIMETS
jgi:hypothetical protein